MGAAPPASSSHLSVLCGGAKSPADGVIVSCFRPTRAEQQPGDRSAQARPGPSAQAMSMKAFPAANVGLPGHSVVPGAGQASAANARAAPLPPVPLPVPAAEGQAALGGQHATAGRPCAGQQGMAATAAPAYAATSDEDEHCSASAHALLVQPAETALDREGQRWSKSMCPPLVCLGQCMQCASLEPTVWILAEPCAGDVPEIAPEHNRPCAPPPSRSGLRPPQANAAICRSRLARSLPNCVTSPLQAKHVSSSGGGHMRCRCGSSHGCCGRGGAGARKRMGW